MTVDEHRGLGLLIALTSSGCLGLPRYTEDDGVVDDAGDGPGPTTAVVDEGPGPEGPGDPDGPVTTFVDDDAESFLFMPDLGGTATDTTTDVSVGGTTDTLPNYGCQAYSTKIGECYDEYAGQAAYGYCLEYLSYIEQDSPECVPVFEEFLVCISVISCRELQNGSFCEVELQKLSECQAG